MQNHSQKFMFQHKHKSQKIFKTKTMIHKIKKKNIQNRNNTSIRKQGKNKNYYENINTYACNLHLRIIQKRPANRTKCNYVKTLISFRWDIGLKNLSQFTLINRRILFPSPFTEEFGVFYHRQEHLNHLTLQYLREYNKI